MNKRERIAVRRDVHRGVANVIKDYFPNARGNGKEDAGKIMLSQIIGAAWDGWAPDAELQKIDDLRKHIGAAVKSLNSMHVVAQLEVSGLVPSLLGIRRTLAELDAAKKQIKLAIRAGRDPGKANSLSIALVADCRAIWARYTGKPAPKSASSARFLAFVEEVFACLEPLVQRQF